MHCQVKFFYFDSYLIEIFQFRIVLCVFYINKPHFSFNSGTYGTKAKLRIIILKFLYIICLKSRPSMFVGALTYVLFIVPLLYLNGIFLYVSSSILGVGGAIFWTAQVNLLNFISTSYSLNSCINDSQRYPLNPVFRSQNSFYN